MLKSRLITRCGRINPAACGLASSLIALAVLATACVGSQSGRASMATPVVFEDPSAHISAGARLSGDGAWDGYGETVDVHGDVLVIGASEWNHHGPGSAYVYRPSGGAWREEAQLTASDRDVYIKQAMGWEGQRFGSSVAVDEGIIAIGAPGTAYPIAGGYTGAVYLYEYDGQAWVETAKLTPDRADQDIARQEVDWLRSDRLKRRSFGALVALDGDTLAVGGDSGTDSVYVFRRGDDGWHEQARVPIPASPGKDLYMASLALLGDTLALSALYVPPQPEQSLLLTGSAIVYVFERTGEAWEESLRFVPEGGEVDYLFLPEVNVGASVSLGGASDQAKLLAVGLSGFPDWSRFNDENEVSTSLFGANADIPEFPESKRQTGAVYILERTEGGWEQQATLKPAGWENPPGPPSSLYVHPSTTDELGTADSAVSFDFVVFPGDFLSEDPEISFFGATVDLNGKQLAVTAGFANVTYLFERRGQDWVYRFRITPQQEKAELWEDYAQVVAISGDTLLLGTPGEFGNSAYVFDLANTSDE